MGGAFPLQHPQQLLNTLTCSELKHHRFTSKRPVKPAWIVLFTKQYLQSLNASSPSSNIHDEEATISKTNPFAAMEISIRLYCFFFLCI